MTIRIVTLLDFERANTPSEAYRDLREFFREISTVAERFGVSYETSDEWYDLYGDRIDVGVIESTRMSQIVGEGVSS